MESEKNDVGKFRQKTCVGDGGELERALDDVFRIWVTVRSCWIMLRKANGDKTLQKSLKFSDCRKRIRKQIPPSCGQTFRRHFVFVWFCESNEIYRFERIFAMRSKCFGQELPPLLNFIQTKKKVFAKHGKPRYEFNARVLRRICKERFSQ